MTKENQNTTPGQELLIAQINSFDELIGLGAGKDIRGFRTFDQIIVLKGMKDSFARESGFLIILLDRQFDFFRFIQNKINLPEDAWIIRIYPASESPDRRVTIDTATPATIRLPFSGIELPVRPYEHRPGPNHFGYNQIITDDVIAESLLKYLRQKIQKGSEEIFLSKQQRGLE